MGSAEDETYDQLLESVLVGPVNIGNYRFVLQVIFDECLCQVLNLVFKANLLMKITQNFLLLGGPGRQILQTHKKSVMKISLAS